jgi:hypothetical protein
LAASMTWNIRRGLSLDACALITHRPLGPASSLSPPLAVSVMKCRRELAW